MAHLFPPGAANPLRYTTWDVVVGGTSPDEIAIARGDDVAKRPVTEDYLQAMIVREPPSGCSVVPGSTPVVSFGDVSSARVATLGINPSWGEFLTKSGALLWGGKQKLATLESLGVATMSEAGPAHVAEVVDGCATYFQRNPYMFFFGWLERVLRRGTASSYYDGSACHLDLVQWATQPVWSGLDAEARQKLLDDGVPHLVNQLAHEDVELILLNGSTVVGQVTSALGFQLEPLGTIDTGSKDQTSKVYRGVFAGATVLGWSQNIPAFRGNRPLLADNVGRWLWDQLDQG